MEKDKTELIDDSATRMAEEDITGSSDPTIRSEGYRSESYEMDPTQDSRGETTGGKTTFFGVKDIRKKVDAELLEVPELEPEEMHTEYMSQLITKPFSQRTEEERLKINRNFLRDAEPLTLERVKEDIQKAPDELRTGFSSLDRWISIPHRKFTLIASRPQHGKTTFMLNLLLNLCRNYPNHHFLYYSYGEPRQDVEIKLINISGEKPFSVGEVEGVANNFKRWKYELKTRDLPVLREKAENDPEYKGLKNFLEVSSRLHVIDSNYHIMDLLDSLRAFNSTLPVGAVFIDSLPAVRPHTVNPALTRLQQIQEVVDQLIELNNDSRFPLILGTQLAAGEKNTPEYDGLNVKFIKELKEPELFASLIIGLQNYAKSEYVGSNVQEHFRSRFYQYILKKAEKMPDSFKNKHPNTVILAKVLLNREGPAPEAEFLYNKWLMKITDFDNGPKHLDQYDFLR